MAAATMVAVNLATSPGSLPRLVVRDIDRWAEHARRVVGELLPAAFQVFQGFGVPLLQRRPEPGVEGDDSGAVVADDLIDHNVLLAFLQEGPNLGTPLFPLQEVVAVDVDLRRECSSPDPLGMAQQAWQLSVLDDDPQPFDQLRCPRLCENLPDTVVVLVPRVLLSLPEPLVPDPVGVLPQRHGCRDDVVEKTVHFIEEAVEALAVLDVHEAHLRKGIVQLCA